MTTFVQRAAARIALPALVHPVQCPRCGAASLRRCRRKLWMRVIPASRRYECVTCDHRALVVFGRIVLGRR